MIKFFLASFKKFKALEIKNPDALYFVGDVKRVYKGDTLLTHTAVKFVNELPSAQDALTDVLYVHLSPNVNETKFMYSTGSKWRRAGGFISGITGEGAIEVDIDVDKNANIKLNFDNTGNVKFSETPKGLKGEVSVPEYSVVELDKPDEGFSTSFSLTRDGVNVGAKINIPKDMVVSSGEVVTNPPGHPKGTYIVLTLANASSDKLYINVSDLVEFVTSGSKVGDMVVISIDNDHKITATITDGTINKEKLDASVQKSLDSADSAVQTITTGKSDGTISVDGKDVKVSGLKSAAYSSVAVNGVEDNNDDLVTSAHVHKAIEDSKLVWSSF